MTIDLPDRLARRVAGQRETLAEIIERGLQQHSQGADAHWREVIEFLASGPRPEAIVAFRPSASHVERSAQLLDKNREGQLTESEEAELDDLGQINHLMTLLKAEARKFLAAQHRE
jgi:hypothetical protein